MQVLKFDVGTLGNHEFNYGLPFLNRILGGGLDVDGVDPNQRFVEGKVAVSGGVEAALQYVPQARAAGADLVFVLLHGGMDAGNYSSGMENPGLYVARDVEGIDGLIMGHQHSVFPDRGSSPA